jgi:hypothetical protein
MAARKGKKATSTALPADVVASGFRVLKPFHHPAADDGNFGFARFYWLEGHGHRQGMLPNFRKKRQPVGRQGEHDTAARVEVLLPPDAPEEYSDLDFLVRRYEEKLLADESTAYAQVTLRFPNARNLHHPYEVARSWVRTFFVDDPNRAVPAFLVLHAPHLAGSQSPVHAHALILPRQLRWFGWGTMLSELASDGGRQEALASWTAWGAGDTR